MRQGVFCGLIFGGVFLGRNFAKSQKMRDGGVLAKFAIARLYGHFGSRGLPQNVELYSLFTITKLRDDCYCTRLFFVAKILEEFSLVATLQNLRKCAMGVSLQKFP